MLVDTRADQDARSATWLALACVVFLCCAPLFIRLDGWDQRNDEAIYSYSVDRILQTGDWLTPRAIGSDTSFLEKPPLKYWMVAGLMKLGLLPENDWGMRFPDAAMCSIAFIYIFLLGRRLSGNVAGFISTFLLFSFEPLLFQHGVRGNHMDAPLLLGYCGGMYHFVRWMEEDAVPRVRHAWFFCGWFFVAFMTKFVAAIFLPLVCVAAVAIRPASWHDWRPKWRDWLRPAAAAVALIAPWFIYETIRDGRWFWHVILMSHVVTRFTGVLMPSHLHPWHHYFTSLWYELQRAGSLPVFLLGFAALIWRGWARRSGAASQIFLARLLILWWLLPEILISFGTSKLFYYSFPFLPPLAIGAGLASAQILELATGGVLALFRKIRFRGFQDATAARWQTRRLSYALTVAGALSFVLALGTAYAGTVDWTIHGVRLFKNSSIIRPFIVGVATWYFAGLGTGVVQLVGVVLLGFLMPLQAYGDQLRRLNEIDAPLRQARDCALAVQTSKHLPHSGVYKMSGDTDHPYYYYLSSLGPYLWPEGARGDELVRRLNVAGQQSLVVLSVEDYVYLGGTMPLPVPVVNPDSGLLPEVSAAAKAANLTQGMPPGVAISKNVVILFPAEYSSCVRQVVRAGKGTTRLDPVGPR